MSRRSETRRWSCCCFASPCGYCNTIQPRQTPSFISVSIRFKQERQTAETRVEIDYCGMCCCSAAAACRFRGFDGGGGVLLISQFGQHLEKLPFALLGRASPAWIQAEVGAAGAVARSSRGQPASAWGFCGARYLSTSLNFHRYVTAMTNRRGRQRRSLRFRGAGRTEARCSRTSDRISLSPPTPRSGSPSALPSDILNLLFKGWFVRIFNMPCASSLRVHVAAGARAE